MIKLIKSGDYRLIETQDQTKIFFLNRRGTYAWATDKGVRFTTHKDSGKDCILSVGKYRLYKVSGEKTFTDGWHLELSLADGLWQGYLLPQGLPSNKDESNKINPTKEAVTRIRTSMLHSLAE